MDKIAVFGASGFGREVRMLIEQINGSLPQWDFFGFFDDGIPTETPIGDSKVLGGIEDLNKIAFELHLVIAIGDPQTKRKVLSTIHNSHLSYPILIHPNVEIGQRAVIGRGCIICAGTIITTDLTIGQHVILNLMCTVAHDDDIGDYCSFMPSVNISGDVIIGEGVFVGTGAKIINQKTIGANSIIGAGAVVSKDIPANCTAVGAPAKPIKFH